MRCSGFFERFVLNQILIYPTTHGSGGGVSKYFPLLECPRTGETTLFPWPFVPLMILSAGLCGFTANKVWFEFRDSSVYRIYVNYTIPELLQYREVYVDFLKKSEAESFYFDLVRGADFHLPEPSTRTFAQPPAEPDPW